MPSYLCMRWATKVRIPGPAMLLPRSFRVRPEDTHTCLVCGGVPGTERHWYAITHVATCQNATAGYRELALPSPKTHCLSANGPHIQRTAYP